MTGRDAGRAAAPSPLGWSPAWPRPLVPAGLKEAAMNARFWYRPRGRGATTGPAADDIIGEQYPPPATRACCCPAAPVVRVVMPPAAGRRRSADLLLCGHHYRVSSQALAAAGAAVSGLPEIAGSKPAALLPGPPGPRLPAS
jgi:hypothetical protein